VCLSSPSNKTIGIEPLEINSHCTLSVQGWCAFLRLLQDFVWATGNELTESLVEVTNRVVTTMYQVLPLRILKNCLGFLAFMGLGTILGFNLSGCSNGSSATTQSSTPAIAIAMTQGVPATMIVGTTTNISATVTNDPANSGVDWYYSANGGGVAQDLFSPAHTNSGQTTIFTAPADVPTRNSVIVTAVSHTDRSKAVVSSTVVMSTVTAVQITQAPAAVPQLQPATFAAIVTGDPANAGVVWAVSCPPLPVADCGSFVGNVYTSNASTPVGSIVNAVAISVVDHNVQSAPVSFMILPPVSIAITQGPPTTLQSGQTVVLAATVSNDASNLGVDWTVQCANAPCGSFSPTHTSGIPGTPNYTTTFTAPLSAATIKITATATANASVTAVATATVLGPPISITITGAPSSLEVNGFSTTIGAALTNDVTNAGADWTATCGSPGACGTLVPTHTCDTGAGIACSTSPTTTYTAPAAVPAGGMVTLTATATADPTKSASVMIQITPAPTKPLQGQFVLLITGQDANNFFFTMFGTLVGDGMGSITGGELFGTDASGNQVFMVPAGFTGTYTIGSDGRGVISIPSITTAVGQITISLSVAFVTPNHALVSESDSWASATGTLDAQNSGDLAAFAASSGANLNGGYSLSLAGAPAFVNGPAATFINNSIAFSSGNQSSITGDVSLNGAVQQNVSNSNVPVAITYTPDSNGFLLNSGSFGIANAGITSGLSTSLAGVSLIMIDAQHFILVGTLSNTDNSPNAFVSGYMTAQPASPAISGSYAFTERGGANANFMQSQFAGGIFTCGSGGALDVIAQGGTQVLQQAVTSTTCTAPSGGRGLISLSGTGGTGISQFAAYPTVDRGLQLIELDGGGQGTGGPSGAGAALQQSLQNPISTGDLSGNYAANLLAAVNFSDSTVGYQGFAGQIVSGGVSHLTGTLDVNDVDTSTLQSTQSLNSSLTNSSYTADNSGRFPMSVSFNTSAPPAGQPIPLSTIQAICYLVDTKTCLLLGTDIAAPGRGIMQLQSNLTGF